MRVVGLQTFGPRFLGRLKAWVRKRAKRKLSDFKELRELE